LFDICELPMAIFKGVYISKLIRYADNMVSMSKVQKRRRNFLVWVKKIPSPNFFLAFFPKLLKILVQILHAYYTFLSTLDYTFLAHSKNELMQWRGVRRLSVCPSVCLSVRL